MMGSALMIATSLRAGARTWVVHAMVAVLISVSFSVLFLDIGSELMGTIGRDPTLTGRSGVWTMVTSLAGNPLVGTGFESFWLGKRLEAMWEKHWWQPNQAHNGYIETYINLGFLGLFFLCGIILSSFRNIRRILILPKDLPCSKLHGILNGKERSKSRGVITSETELAKKEIHGFDFIGFRIGYLLAFMIYNLTEAAFKGLHLLFFIFFVITIEYAHVKSDIVVSNTESLPKNTRKPYNIPRKLDKSLK
jgi:O-antigen ligase